MGGDTHRKEVKGKTFWAARCKAIHYVSIIESGEKWLELAFVKMNSQDFVYSVYEGREVWNDSPQCFWNLKLKLGLKIEEKF